MKQSLIQVAAIAIIGFLWCSTVQAQEDEIYDFDGVADMNPQPSDPTDWMTSVNWSDGGVDPNPLFGPPIPDFGTRVEFTTSTFGVNAPAIGPGDAAQAFEVRIGREEGAGLLTMTGGTLVTVNSCSVTPFTCNRRLRVGSADTTVSEMRHPGTFNLLDGTVTTDTLWVGSGSHGEMSMSGGVLNTRSHLYMDWTSDLTYNTESVLNMNGGRINVGGALRMYRLSNLNLVAGEIVVTGAAELGTQNMINEMFPQTPDVDVAITGGLLQSNGFLQIGGSVVLNGGLLRANSFNESLSAGTIEVNGSGILQFNNAQESIANVQTLVSSGFITTSSPMGTAGFVIQVVNVSGTNFTQLAFPAIVGVPGDYNNNGTVDAADYVIYRKKAGTNFTLLHEKSAQPRRALWIWKIMIFGDPGLAARPRRATASALQPKSPSRVQWSMGCWHC